MFQGVRAIWSPETGIVDWAEVARHYARVFTDNGGTVLTDFEAVKFTGVTNQRPVYMANQRPVLTFTKHRAGAGGCGCDLT